MIGQEKDGTHTLRRLTCSFFAASALVTALLPGMALANKPAPPPTKVETYWFNCRADEDVCEAQVYNDAMNSEDWCYDIYWSNGTITSGGWCFD